MKVPGRVGVEAREDGLFVAPCLLGLSEYDLGVTVLAEHPLERDVAEDLVSTDWTPEELEQCFTMTIEYFQTHC
jgi:hypothetical protein